MEEALLDDVGLQLAELHCSPVPLGLRFTGGSITPLHAHRVVHESLSTMLVQPRRHERSDWHYIIAVVSHQAWPTLTAMAIMLRAATNGESFHMRLKSSKSQGRRSARAR